MTNKDALDSHVCVVQKHVLQINLHVIVQHQINPHVHVKCNIIITGGRK